MAAPWSQGGEASGGRTPRILGGVLLLLNPAPERFMSIVHRFGKIRHLATQIREPTDSRERIGTGADGFGPCLPFGEGPGTIAGLPIRHELFGKLLQYGMAERDIIILPASLQEPGNPCRAEAAGRYHPDRSCDQDPA